MASFIIRSGMFAMSINVKLAQRIVCSLSHWERVGERETGIASFIFRGGSFAMPVRRTLFRGVL